MKKITLGIVAALASIFAFTACDYAQMESLLGNLGGNVVESVTDSEENEETSIDGALNDGNGGNQTDPDDENGGNQTDPDDGNGGNQTDPDDGNGGNQTDPDDENGGNQTDPDDGNGGNQTDPDEENGGNQTDPDDGNGGDQTDPDDGEDDEMQTIEGTRVVDFTQATNVKDVTDQGYYLDGCPTMGKVNVLVIPVDFSDVKASSKGYTTAKLKTIFNGAAGTTDYYSVKEYYKISSYGQLDLNFVVLDNWLRAKNTSTYYARQKESDEWIGDQVLLNEALNSLNSSINFKDFDSDKNGVIDAVVMINTLEIDSDKTMNWAFRYWNQYADNEGDYYEYDGVYANDYMWASYKFMMESYNDNGQPTYSSTTMNPYTYIHEFGHILGADDYYNTGEDYDYAPLDGYDVMDMMTGDHNPYSKFNYGWVTKARLITAEESVTVSLKSFAETGEAVIIANNWDDKLGAYQEYFVVVYYKNTGLNSGEGGYFDDEGILVYHVNATLYVEEYEGEIYYDVANNNTDPLEEYGTENNLIELIESVDGSYVYGENDSLSANEKMDNGQKISYVFTVNSLTEEKATITFRKNA